MNRFRPSFQNEDPNENILFLFLCGSALVLNFVIESAKLFLFVVKI